ncbi:TIGR03571 family LLM class oxidoreductase [Pseudodonghicola flavimaris]|uniref:TIGR03571 family LLM class oxidoreductase n=1 Tax=Pseudodonghicola flavimaris TaxID=3050036 RepID=A0ABT7F581_9RHOB|nr:TIGR03571 family LLM class oxidoreductase [Pseudodonghicola flavimaris]MDK3019768.1 TIGR03571 family LLM class oxidoreductase [Pseudodonghicola flavimaris]
MLETTAMPRSFCRAFSENRLSVGLITPLEAYPDSPFPTLKDHQTVAKQAEDAGFGSIWLRDVPFYDPNFGDAAQMLDPFVYAGYLSAVTSTITLGTTGVVLPLREPVSVAKQALSVDRLTEGRFLLGLSTGDRPVEYPAFNIDFEDRGARYREAVEVIRTLSENRFPRAETMRFGTFSGNLDMHPKPVHGRLPIMAVGRSRQPIEWLARNVDAWIWAVDDDAAIREILAALKSAAGDGTPPAYGYSSFFDLDPNPEAPYQRFYNVVRIGRKALTERLLQHRDLGVRHVALNLKPSRRSAQSVIEEMGAHVLPALEAA